MQSIDLNSNRVGVPLLDTEKVVDGHFQAYVFEDGKKHLHFERKNLIVNSARKIMARAVSDCAGNYCINQFRLGGDNSLESALMLEPARPQPEDTELVYSSNLFVRNKPDIVETVPAFTVSYPNEPNETSVMFEILIGKTEANILDPTPTVYVAAGLYVANGAILFASQTFPVLTKTPNREFLFLWTLRF
jgi:hypothetical protein